MLKYLLVLTFLTTMTAQAQLFDSIGGTLKDSNLGGMLGTATPTPTDTSFLSYTPDPVVSQQVLTEFIENLKTSGQVDPAQVTQMESALRENLTRENMQRFIDELFAGEGFKLNNLADVLAIYFIASFVVLNDMDSTTTEQDLAVRDQITSIFSTLPDIQQLSDKDKQQAAEGLILFTIFLANDWQQAQQGIEGYDLNTIKAYTGDTLLQMGVDYTQFDFTQQGLIRKSTGSTTQPDSTTTSNPTIPSPTTPTTSQQNPLAPSTTSPLGADPLAGSYQGQNISLTLTGAGTYTGELVFNGQAYPVQAVSNGQNITGNFSSNGSTFEFSATLTGTTLTLQSGGSSFVLEKNPGN